MSSAPGFCTVSRLTLQDQVNGTNAEVLPLTDTTAEATNTQNVVEGAAAAATTAAKPSKPRAPRQPKQRGPPEDGIPSKNKVMVANLPYDLGEEKVWRE